MSAITYDKIKITSPWDIQSIYELVVNHTLNRHATLRLRALLTEESGAKAGLEETVDTQIKVYIDDDGQKYYIFIGRLKEAHIGIQGGVYILTADFMSETVLLDRKEKSRSFQNIELTYADIVKQIMRDYPDKTFELTAPAVRMDGPRIQYRETDWDFILRMASQQEAVIVPDIGYENRAFAFGYPKGGTITLPEGIPVTSGKNLTAYHEAKAWNSQMQEGEFAYFEVETFDRLNIGDRVAFQGYPMVVGAVNIALKNQLLVYTAILIREMAVRQNPIYNKKLVGVSLEGKVLELRDQEIKLHLSIDKEQKPAEAYWYPFSPPSTDFMYLMPQLGTIAGLYIPGLQEQNAIITGNLRTNGTECEKTGDPNTRYIGTEYGQELKVAPGGIYITAGQSKLTTVLDDAKGVMLTSHDKMDLSGQEIIIKSEKAVSFHAPGQVLFATPTTFVSLENETHVLAFPDVKIDCTDETAFASVEQPQPQPEQQKDRGITSTGLAVGVVAGLAVVGCLLAFTGVGLVAALLIGGIVGGLAARATSDIEQGEVSSLSDYLDAAATGGLIGLTIGAIAEAAAPFLLYYGLPGGMTLWNLLYSQGPLIPLGGKGPSGAVKLPPFDGRTTQGVLVTSDGRRIPFTSGNPDPRYSNYPAASHVEGKAALHMRENGITNGTVYHNNTNGTCGYCDNMIETLLPEGATMNVVPPANAVANNSRAVAIPSSYTGNNMSPKVNPKFGNK